jgi:hypothetical protein
MGLIFAFAQPFFTSPKKSQSRKHIYIILDNSYSMQAKGKKGALMQRAIQDLLETAPEKLHFSLLTNTEAFWNTDIQSIQKELQKIEYSATPFQLEPILSQIKAHPSQFKKEIVVITDGIGLESKQFQMIENNEDLHFIVPKAEQQNNVSVDSVLIRETSDNFYELSIQISNYGLNTQPISMALYNENKLITKTRVTLNKTKELVPLSIPKKAFHGFVSISDNGVAFDNIFYFSISERKKINCISIGDVDKSNFLERIYTSDEFNFRKSNLAQLDYNQLGEQDAIVLNELDEIPQALQTTLLSFINKGGNIILIPSAKSTPSNLNSFTQKIGDLQFQSLDSNEKLISTIHFNHPVFKNVFENTISNFQYPKTKTSFDITTTSSAVLSYQDKSPFLTSINKGAGAVFIFSSPLNQKNTNFQQSPLIVPVLYQLAQAGKMNEVEAFTIGSNDSYWVKIEGAQKRVLTIKNENEQFIPTQEIMSTKVKMNFGEYPKKAGNFCVFDYKKKIQNISFNYNRSESNLYHNNENLLSGKNKMDSLATFFNHIESENNDSQIWKWFLIFALLMLLTETAIIRFVK